MRAVSNAVQQILDSSYGTTKDVVVLTIKEQFNPPVPETTLYFANGAGIIVDGQIYENKLRSVGQIKFAKGVTSDVADVTIENVSRDLGFVLTNPNVIFDGAKVEIKKAFKTSDTGYEGVTLFVGQVKDIKVAQDVLALSIISDMSKRGTSVAKRAITQRCIWKFNVNGSGVGPDCGWQLSQPGNATSCDHDLTSANGCKAHGNEARFGGVPSFTALNKTTTNGYDPNDGGEFGHGPNGGYCIHPLTLVLCEIFGQKFTLPAYKVKKGDTIVSMDVFGNLVKTQVVDNVKGLTTKILTIITSKGYRISCSPTHPILKKIGDTEGTSANLFAIDDEILVYTKDEKKPFIDTVDTIELFNKACNVYMLQLEEPYHVFMAGDVDNGFIVSHNTKPIGTNGGAIILQQQSVQ